MWSQDQRAESLLDQRGPAHHAILTHGRHHSPLGIVIRQLIAAHTLNTTCLQATWHHVTLPHESRVWLLYRKSDLLQIRTWFFTGARHDVFEIRSRFFFVFLNKDRWGIFPAYHSAFSLCSSLPGIYSPLRLSTTTERDILYPRRSDRLTVAHSPSHS